MGQGKRLIDLRIKAGLSSRREAAKLIGIDHTYLRKLELEVVALENAATWIPDRVATVYNSSVQYIKTGLPVMSSVSIPVWGAIPCGQPGLVEPHVDQMLDVAQSALGSCRAENLYALKVSGDSLIGDGIQNGDFLIVDRTAPFVDGEIYIICIQGECCARHVHRQGERAILRSSSDMQDIMASELDLQGGVITSVRMSPRPLLRMM